MAIFTRTEPVYVDRGATVPLTEGMLVEEIINQVGEENLVAGPPGRDGDAGDPGADGRTIHATTGRPSNGTGADGDLAFDEAASVIYRKAGGVWSAGASLVGAPGRDGEDGAGLVDGAVADRHVAADAGISESKLALASDADAATASRRTLGTGSRQACAGDDARLSDARVPTGSAAGGHLTGTYPRAQIANGVIGATAMAASVKPSGSATATDEALRRLGTGANEACAGNDSRLSDQRTPADGSVTAAKIASALKPSAGAAAGTESLRALGTTSSTALRGDYTPPARTVRTVHTFAIDGEVAAQDVPGFYAFPMAAGGVVELAAVRVGILDGTSVAVAVNVNGSAATGLTALSATPSPRTTDPTDVVLIEGDEITITTSSPTGTPRGLMVTIVLEHVI